MVEDNIQPAQLYNPKTQQVTPAASAEKIMKNFERFSIYFY